ncbi:hypothetical protein LT85_3848 [Collimonas arenae]|uniref:Uncharacterized protein n=1 Tax=Collimonas arenae TaxID=279058 RepID=A0A0A1FEQ7_9BURK|nr:hypothetical protein LT85_3848 [Collimonas arenae]
MLCFVPLETTPTPKIFGFAEFIAAVALLAVVYTITDVRYKFRIAVTPGWMYISTFYLIGVVGLQTLLTEVWMAAHWWVPKTVDWLTRTTWQAAFGLLFLGTFLTWMYYAFIRPPIFGRRNAARFAMELYRYILRGNDEELKVIANELARSAAALIKHSREIVPPPHNEKESAATSSRRAKACDYAFDILLLIANRKFCRQIVATSPVTVLAFFRAITETGKFSVPVGQFSRNISSEAILQKGSFLYGETEGYDSGLLGYIKPVSQALYSNYALIEQVGRTGSSPLDIYYDEQWTWDAKQWGGFCRAALISLKGSFVTGSIAEPTMVLNRALNSMESAYRDLHQLDGKSFAYESGVGAQLRTIVDFVKKAIDILEQAPNPPTPIRQRKNKHIGKNIYDHIADLLYNICRAAAGMKAPSNDSWSIQYVVVWSAIFERFDNRRVRKIIQCKVRRLLYDQIEYLATFPNYEGAAILGYCLNMLGLTSPENRNGIYRVSYPLTKTIHSWTRRNYLWLQKECPAVADNILCGDISFERARDYVNLEDGLPMNVHVPNRLVLTARHGMSREPRKYYLNLDVPVAPPINIK